MMHERERNQTTDTSTLSNNSQQRQQLTRWMIQNGIHRTRCMRGREIKQQTHQHWVTTVNNDNNLPAGRFKMAFTEHDAWEGEKIKQQTHQHWVTTDNNDNNLPPGRFKMAFTEHDAWEGEKIKQQTHQHWVTTDNNDNNLPPGRFKMAFTEHDAWEGEKSNNRHINTE